MFKIRKEINRLKNLKQSFTPEGNIKIYDQSTIRSFVNIDAAISTNEIEWEKQRNGIIFWCITSFFTVTLALLGFYFKS